MASIEHLEHVVGIKYYVEWIQYNVSGDKCPEKVVGNKFGYQALGNKYQVTSIRL